MRTSLWQGSLEPPATITVSNWPYMCSLATRVWASLARSLLALAPMTVLQVVVSIIPPEP